MPRRRLWLALLLVRGAASPLSGPSLQDQKANITLTTRAAAPACLQAAAATAALLFQCRQLRVPSGPCPQPASEERKAYAVISTGSLPMYSFFAPLTALIWRRRQGIQPLLLLVNDVSSNATRTGSGRWGSSETTALILR